MISKKIGVWATVNTSSSPIIDKLGTVTINDCDKKSDDEIEREALDTIAKDAGFENIDEYHKLMPSTSLRITSEFTTDVFFDSGNPQINQPKVSKKKGRKKRSMKKPKQITINYPSANDKDSVSVRYILTAIAIVILGLTLTFIIPTYSLYSIFGLSTSVLKVVLTAFIFSTVTTIVLLCCIK